ncbi:MAG: hydantoinase/oxoprolinase family protein [Desulfomonile tiedjei]|uniref:Hydantoinase/oxoprolinase family protein n=1 Tax=Desulfomonile tiedjei TaxID=2358 RepID=A0A9D6V452_9BACT|nr:hydantoinase/oxoprolinase family protein [Desulfomonile tiedjei]
MTRYRIGVDVGGTFTDFLLMNEEGDAQVYKVLSTPADPSIAVIHGLSVMAEKRNADLGRFLGQVEIIVHGTTVTTNAVLTGNVAKTGLLTTRGFRDALQMRRGIREELYNNRYLPPRPIVPRYLRIPVEERIDFSGKEIRPLSVQDLEDGAAKFKENGVEAVAICFMHSYADGSHEEAAAERLRRLMPDAYLSVSSRVLPQVRFYNRVSTTVLNSAVGPILEKYIRSLTAKLEMHDFKGLLLIMQSNGGVTSPEVVTELASSTLLSGPAAAPVAGIAYTRLHGYGDFITVDMGGTSFDAALIKDSTPLVTTDGKVNRFALALPMMDVHTIGAGGGSIAWIDDSGLLRMGPKSAGARPGPVCYGLGGTEPTCSDANLLLGYLNADHFAGGKMTLDRPMAEKAILEKVAQPLGMPLPEAAYGMCHIMNINMASAIREISVQRGYDPREFLLVCAGGAGPIHAAMIASELEIPRILVPKESSIFCAAGMLLSDLKHDFGRTYHTIFSGKDMDVARFLSLIDDLQREGDRILALESIPVERRMFQYSLDLRYVRQYHEVNVPVTMEDLRTFNGESMKEAFHRQHDRLYGYSLREEGTEVELVNLRLTAIGVTDKPALKEEEYRGKNPNSCLKGTRPVFIPSQRDFGVVPVYDGDRMGFGHELQGPAIIEQTNTTIFVPPEYEVACDAYGSYLLRLV